MRIIFEEHQYKAAEVQAVLKDISTLQDVDQKISVGYVGYYFNPTIKDCVFILPKTKTSMRCLLTYAAAKREETSIQKISLHQQDKRNTYPRITVNSSISLLCGYTAR